jgi:anti-sigma B factor antagonist
MEDGNALHEATAPMQIDLHQARGEVTVVTPKGRLNVATAPLFRERVSKLVEAGTRQIVVDLGEVSFVDSSGIGALIGALKLVRQLGGDLRIARPNRNMQVLLDVTFLSQLLWPYGDVEEALSKF